jgi:hypothetical protein
MKKQQQKRTEFALQSFLHWLNWEDAPADDFRKLTNLIVKLSLEAERGALEYESKVRWDRRIDPICRRIAQRFPLYSVPYFLRESGSTEEVPYLDRRPLRKDLKGSYDLQACFEIGHLFELFSAGVLRTIRRCERRECRRYFCGRLGKRFCSGSCKRKMMRQAPHFKEMNALHQQVHYRAERVKNLEALAAMDPDRRKEYEDAKKALEKVRKLVKRAKKRLASKGR